MIIDETELGFDLDPEVVDLLDAILVNIATDDTLKEEFKKLNFIRSLGDKYDKRNGPIKQLLTKVANIEKDRLEANLDLRRLISDMEHLAEVVSRSLGDPHAKSLEGMFKVNKRLKYYSFRK